MLTTLVIQNVVLMDRLTLPLKEGLNVFTGETGAGKSILLDALGLALGARSDAGLIRVGADQASVTASFSGPFPPALTALADENGLTLDDPLLLRRVVGKDGKSRAFLNDQPLSVSLLRRIGETLLEIHGQFETHGLLDAATHRGLLDAVAGTDGLRGKVGTAYGAWQQAENACRDARTSRERAQAEEDFLRAAVAEIDDLAPENGETETLAERRTTLQHREKILDALQTAVQALDGERGATASLTQAGKALARIADKAKGLADLLTLVDRAANDVAEASQQLDRFLHDTDAEPDALQRIEERLFALRAVARKHNTGAEDLPTLRETLRTRLGLLTDQGDSVAALAKAVVAAKAAYKELAENLSAKRQKAALDMAKRIKRELPPLKLERAQFVVDVAPLAEPQWNADGMDRVAFLASTNPGTPAGPLQKVASGGELARFMLALKVVLRDSDPIPVLVFDEVDSGIGGATASAVGERLAQLAEHVQILVVTHSPQVAARGQNHLRVLKQTTAKHATTDVRTLNAEERVEEIARMLAGTEVTDAARHAAKSLLG